MFQTRKCFLLIIAVLALNQLRAQNPQDSDVLEGGDQWILKLSELESSSVVVPESYMSFKEITKAKDKIENEISEITLSIDKDPEDRELYNELVLQNTNASLWYSEVTTEDFQVFLRRLVTGRPINKDVIQDLKKTYIKWLKDPSIKNLNRYSQMLLETGKSYEILTKLKVSTEDLEDGQIKYRSLTNKNTEILNGPVAEKTIPVGNYYIWLEKDGKILSDNSNGYNCIRSTKTIVFSGLQ